MTEEYTCVCSLSLFLYSGTTIYMVVGLSCLGKMNATDISIVTVSNSRSRCSIKWKIRCHICFSSSCSSFVFILTTCPTSQVTPCKYTQIVDISVII